jgi:hypothetical protein
MPIRSLILKEVQAWHNCRKINTTHFKEVIEMFKIALRYTRYALASLANVAFAMSMN